MDENIKTILEHQKETDRKLEVLAKENKELRGLNGDRGNKKLKEITDRTARLRVVDDRVVIGFKNIGSKRKPRFVYEKQDPSNPKNVINYVDIILEKIGDEEEKVISVKHEDFLEESEIVKAKILHIQDKEWDINQGETVKKELNGFSMVELDFTVDMKVKGVTKIYTLQLPSEFDSREVEISENYINM